MILKTQIPDLSNVTDVTKLKFIVTNVCYVTRYKRFFTQKTERLWK
jgi:hypothetical protein